MIRGDKRTSLVVVAIASAIACQSPTDPDDVIEWDEVVTVTPAPDPIVADTQTGGRTYRVVRGNNQPDELLPYDWHAVFSTTINLTDKATHKDVDLDFPVRITSTTLAVKQASGGIVTPPTGGETEKFDFVTLNATGNQVAATNSPVSLTFELWYDLPSLRKEAVVTVAFAFVDNDGTTFQRSADIRVAP
jgi:hypothetical protein